MGGDVFIKIGGIIVMKMGGVSFGHAPLYGRVPWAFIVVSVRRQNGVLTKFLFPFLLKYL